MKFFERDMHMSRNILYRAALLHLSVSPLLSISARATTASAAHHLHTHTNPLLQSPNLRSFPALFHQCPSLLLPSNQHHHFSTTTMTSSDSAPTNNAQNPPQSETRNTAETEHAQPAESKEPQLALPPADGTTSQVEVGGSTFKFDHLGPMVVNVDGTLSRIGNWEQMTEIEKRNTLRVLGKRNQQRLAALRAAEGAKDDGDKGGEK